MSTIKVKLLKLLVNLSLYFVNMFLFYKSFKYVNALTTHLGMTDADLVAATLLLMVSVVVFMFTCALTDSYFDNRTQAES